MQNLVLNVNVLIEDDETTEKMVDRIIVALTVAHVDATVEPVERE
jgi:hypothetical protein